MTSAASQTIQRQPLLVELDEKTWNIYLDRAESWLDNVLLIQSTFSTLAADVQQRVDESHFKELLGGIAEVAKRHESEAEKLYGYIDRTPAKWRKAAGTLSAQFRKAVSNVVGLTGGARDPWPHLHQLYLASHNSVSAFAAAEQIGYSLGLDGLADECFRIIAEKYPHTLMLQELTLETVPFAILYDMPIGMPVSDP